MEGLVGTHVNAEPVGYPLKPGVLARCHPSRTHLTPPNPQHDLSAAAPHGCPEATGYPIESDLGATAVGTHSSVHGQKPNSVTLQQSLDSRQMSGTHLRYQVCGLGLIPPLRGVRRDVFNYALYRRSGRRRFRQPEKAPGEVPVGQHETHEVWGANLAWAKPREDRREGGVERAQDEEPGSTLRHEMDGIHHHHVASIAKPVQGTNDLAEPFTFPIPKEAHHVLQDDELRSARPEGIKEPVQAPKRARVFAVKPGTVPGEGHINARERCPCQIHVRYVSGTKLPNVTKAVAVGREVGCVNLQFLRANVVGEHGRPAARLQGHLGQANAGEEISKSSCSAHAHGRASLRRAKLGASHLVFYLVRHLFQTPTHVSLSKADNRPS